MLHEQLADETKASPILGQGGLLIVLDLNDLPACAPDYENVRCIPMLRSFMTVFESEGLSRNSRPLQRDVALLGGVLPDPNCRKLWGALFSR